MFDVAIIGGGPAGYVCAIRASQLGLKVACIDKEKNFGGTCLNWGCIPSKTLLHSSHLYEIGAAHGDRYGLKYKELTPDFPQMMNRKGEVIDQLARGIDGLFAKNKITPFHGTARLTSPTMIAVGDQTIEAKNIVIATGSEPIPLPFLPFDEKRILSSTGALSLQKIPKSLILVGAGVVGLELGSVYRRLGTQVTVIEFLDHICPSLDRTISTAFQKILTAQGLTFHLSSKVTAGKTTDSGVQLTVNDETPFEAEVALVAIGRRPFSKDLGLESLGVARTDRGFIQIDGSFRTTVPNIYAIGDVVEGPMLAHKGSEEGVAVAEIIAGGAPHINYAAIPTVVYTSPEAAGVGLTEEACKSYGLPIKTGTFPMKANSRARCTGEDEGLVKVIAHAETDRLLGLHILCAQASEMIGEGVAALEKGATASDLMAMSHAHPTFTEAIHEAALDTAKRRIHL